MLRQLPFALQRVLFAFATTVGAMGAACSSSDSLPESTGGLSTGTSTSATTGSGTSSSSSATSTTGATTGAGTGTGAGGAGGSGGGTVGAMEVAGRLGKSNFLIGMGNDDDYGFKLGSPLDLHYSYLTQGWPTWNANGGYVDIGCSTAKKNNAIPMFTLYSIAGLGEGNASTLTNDGYMKQYFDEAKLMFQRIAAYDGPAVVHFEPDWWGFAQQQSPGGDPSRLPVHVASLAPDCASQPDNMIGMGKCLVALARKYAPKAVVGFHASDWSDPSPAKIGSYLLQIGAGDGDIVIIETLDRDAGCFEAHGDDCDRNDGPWYWDETNQTSPNFHEHLAWAKALSDAVGKPILWWQMPFGVPSATPGGSPGKYRDNRVKYLFEHTGEFVAAGGLGAVFGVGTSSQTFPGTDGDQFKNALAKYRMAPTSL